MTTGTWFFDQNYADWCTSIIKSKTVIFGTKTVSVYFYNNFRVEFQNVVYLFTTKLAWDPKLTKSRSALVSGSVHGERPTYVSWQGFREDRMSVFAPAHLDNLIWNSCSILWFSILITIYFKIISSILNNNFLMLTCIQSCGWGQHQHKKKEENYDEIDSFSTCDPSYGYIHT